MRCVSKKFPENSIWHFLQDNLQEVTKSYFLGKIRKYFEELS